MPRQTSNSDVPDVNRWLVDIYSLATRYCFCNRKRTENKIRQPNLLFGLDWSLTIQGRMAFQLSFMVLNLVRRSWVRTPVLPKLGPRHYHHQSWPGPSPAIPFTISPAIPFTRYFKRLIGPSHSIAPRTENRRSSPSSSSSSSSSLSSWSPARWDLKRLRPFL